MGQLLLSHVPVQPHVASMLVREGDRDLFGLSKIPKHLLGFFLPSMFECVFAPFDKPLDKLDLVDARLFC